MINIQYKIEFFNEWHTGSGLSAGADVDVLVIKDKNGLPFIPGKTIKGLLRQALEEILDYRGEYESKKESIIKTFGLLSEKKSNDDNKKEDKEQENRIERGSIFFSNATLSTELSNNIVDKKISKFLYRAVASTAIDENGVAKKNSLRRMETTIPVVLYGEILGISDDLSEDIAGALSYIKRLGANRHRGLGRCQFSVIKKEEVKA